MTEHPLARGDLGLIQDLLLTKIVMLCSAGARENEWRFELRSMRQLSAESWTSRNAFLLDYSLARVLAAELDRRARSTAQESRPRLTPTAQHFVDAVAAGDGTTARSIWSSAVVPEADVLGSALTAPLVRQLMVALPATPLEHLPPAFESGPTTTNPTPPGPSDRHSATAEPQSPPTGEHA